MDEVLPSADVVARIGAEFPLAAIDANYPGEVAERWRYTDGGGEIGVISSVTQAFCSSCTRIRLSTEGQLYPCLLYTSDPADERSRVDLGRRRIHKKKKNTTTLRQES